MQTVVLFCLFCFAVMHSTAFQHTYIFDVAKKPFYRNKSQGFGYVNFLFHPNSTLDVPDENKLQLAAQNYNQCLVACASNRTCFSINFGKQPIYFERGEAQYLCELLATDKYNSSSAYQNSTTFNHYSIKSECNKHPCLHNNPCVPDYDNDTYECLCPRPAFEGKHCKDVNECTTGQHDCSVNATCTNIIGSFACICNDGYTGNGKTCADVDECVTGQHACSVHANCTNLIGSFTCTCKDGFLGNGSTCTDVDECVGGQHDCSTNSACTNTMGSFYCSQNVLQEYTIQDSEILKDYGNASYLTALTNFMNEIGSDVWTTPWIRCWSGNNDGFDVTTTFHPQCDGKGPTVFIIRDNQYIWGGYANIPWESPAESGYKSSTSSFMFSLYNIQGFSPHKFQVFESRFAIYHNANWAPSFSTDLRMTNFASTSGVCYMRSQSYDAPPGCVSHAACDFFNGIAGSYGSGFSIDDIEVFYKSG